MSIIKVMVNGLPGNMASIMADGIPSRREGNTKMSEA